MKKPLVIGLGLLLLPLSVQAQKKPALLKSILRTETASAKTQAALAAPFKKLVKKIISQTPQAQPWQHSVFYIQPTHQTPVSASGFVFQTQYQGRWELWGVIAAHIYSRPGQEMELVFYNGKKPIIIKARVVLSAAPARLDASLLKLEATEEFLQFVHPLSLQTAAPSAWETFTCTGYSRQEPSVAANRRILLRTPSLLTTNYTIEPHKRAGLCGSPLLNKKGEVVGLHCGSFTESALRSVPAILPPGQKIWPIQQPNQRVSFVIPAQRLLDLVQAYRNGGSLKRPLLWEGKTIAQIDIHEFIHSVSVLIDNPKEGMQIQTTVLSGAEPFLNEQNLKTAFYKPGIQRIMIELRSPAQQQTPAMRHIFVTDFETGYTKEEYFPL